MAAATTIENGARDILNAGLGAYKVLEARFVELQATVVKGYQELVSRGSQDKSEAADSLRKKLDSGISYVKEVQLKLQK